MGSRLTTLTSSDIQRFERDGYVVVRQAFPRADGLAMERRWWSELEDTHNIRQDDGSSWRQIPASCGSSSSFLPTKVVSWSGGRTLRGGSSGHAGYFLGPWV